MSTSQSTSVFQDASEGQPPLRERLVGVTSRNDDLFDGDKEEGLPVHHSTEGDFDALTLVYALGVILFGGLNYVAGKIRSKPLGSYDVFVSLFNNLAYTTLYWSILGIRIWQGAVKRDQLQFVWAGSFWKGAWKWFVLTGLLDCCGNVIGFISQPHVPGAIFSLMNQAIVPFTAIASLFLLGKRYTLMQLLAMSVVVTGAVLAIIPALLKAENTHHHGPAGMLFFSLAVALSTLPNAMSFALKEKVFRLYESEHPSSAQTLDLFIVNSHSSLFGLLFFPVSLWLNIVMGETRGRPLGAYLASGFSCFAGKTPADCLCYEDHCEPWGCCTHAPAAYIVYVLLNVAFNIALLALLKRGSALLAFICLKAVLPLSVVLFASFSWPLLDKVDENVSGYTWASLVVVMIGVVGYKWTTHRKEQLSADYFEGREPPCLWPLRKRGRVVATQH